MHMNFHLQATFEWALRLDTLDEVLGDWVLMRYHLCYIGLGIYFFVAPELLLGWDCTLIDTGAERRSKRDTHQYNKHSIRHTF